MGEELVFEGKILDNVHGFIEYTKAEERIMNTMLFKRLQSIKQLSVADWVFPGSEHTRFIHSLGVMYIADKIAIRLGLGLEERKIIRLAGLLHDIGHYPLSHVCEFPYKKALESFPDDTFCREINREVKSKIDKIDYIDVDEYMKQSSGFHHEKIGALVIQHNKEIRDIIINECGNDAPLIIADMITGNISREKTNPLYVQILHSELDADGIDYLMRDAMFSGTSFGSFELDQLIGCMTKREYNGKGILCITPKGIAAADQYFINKFFSYSQVVYNKHICITEWMAEQIVNWMQKNNAYFPQQNVLKNWVENEMTADSYIDFTDNYFWSSLQNLLTNPLVATEPQFIRYFCKYLLRHNELEYIDGSEKKYVLQDYRRIKEQIVSSESYKKLDEDNIIGILLERKMSKEIQQDEFETSLQHKFPQSEQEKDDDSTFTEEDLNNVRMRRFMECICIDEKDKELRLLCDDERSLMHTMYKIKLVILRMYKLDFTGIN